MRIASFNESTNACVVISSQPSRQASMSRKWAGVVKERCQFECRGTRCIENCGWTRTKKRNADHHDPKDKKRIIGEG